MTHEQLSSRFTQALSILRFRGRSREMFQPGRLFDPERAALQLLDVIEELKPSDSGRLFDFEGEEITF